MPTTELATVMISSLLTTVTTESELGLGLFNWKIN